MAYQEITGTITSGGVSQTVISVAQTPRIKLIYQNQSAQPLIFSASGAPASSTLGILVSAGLIYEFSDPCAWQGAIPLCPQGPISVWGAISGLQFYVFTTDGNQGN